MKSGSTNQDNFGLAYWMSELLKEAGKSQKHLSNKTVHDLRVVLRRCRSMADGFRAVDPDKDWKKMRRQATELFDSLGALRDCHVMQEWVEKLGRKDDPITQGLQSHLQQQEPSLKQQAEDTLKAFDDKQWEQWSGLLPRRVGRLRADSEVFQALALEKLNFARRLHTKALKTENDADLHQLRIAIKKFRYLVENFLPRLHEDWGEGLKQAQDVLGEIHDLDVVRQKINELCQDAPAASREPWEQRLKEERAARIHQYRERTSGKNSLWSKWRSGLPRGKAARHASLTRLQAWSSFLDSDIRHARRVARFAVQLYDGLGRSGLIDGQHRDDRELLRAAATVHEVGRAEGNKNHHKKTEKMVSELRHLVGWTQQDITTMARVARYHRGTLPRVGKLQDLSSDQRNKIKMLAGILRLANAFDADHDGSIQRFTLARNNGFVVIRALGLAADSPLAETIAAARHLLEMTCDLPVLVQPMPKRGNKRPARK